MPTLSTKRKHDQSLATFSTEHDQSFANTRDRAIPGHHCRQKRKLDQSLAHTTERKGRRPNPCKHYRDWRENVD
jgi:hypothetical protein